MATRNLTQKFESLRADVRKRRPARGRDGLLGQGEERSDDSQVAVGIDHSLPPDWVDILESIQKDLAKAKENSACRCLLRLGPVSRRLCHSTRICSSRHAVVVFTIACLCL